MADLSAERVRANLAEVREEIAAAAAQAGREAGGVEIVAAVKYVPLEGIGTLAEAGLTVLGENRAQDLQAKATAHPELTWDFIGLLQSRKVKQILPFVRLIHSVASDSVLAQLDRHATGREDIEVLVEVNIAAEEGKGGIAPDALGAFIGRCPVPVTGLMAMPPLAAEPEASRPWFAALRGLAEQHGLARLSMGTTQDFPVAVEEGATLVRIGTRLYG